MNEDLPLAVTLEVRDRCLCLHLQRAARSIARRFDEALRPLNLTSGQYSLLMSVNRPEPPLVGEVALTLGMDRTTLTANLKPLDRRGLLAIIRDPKDKRRRCLQLTRAGRELLSRAVPVWRATHDEIERRLPDGGGTRLRAELLALSFPQRPA